MGNLKYFDSDTNTWRTLVGGPQGPQGIQGIQGETGTGPVNAIINGAFEINQRNFSTATTDGFGFDRFKNATDGVGATFSSQAFTLGSASVVGYEATNFWRGVTTGQSSVGTYTILRQTIEDVRSFANQTVTFSFWAKAGSGTPKIAVEFQQYFGSGGSTAVNVPVEAKTITTSWTRYESTVTMPSIAGKTIGTGSFVEANLWISAGSTWNTRASSIGIQSNTFDIWGVQVEAGSTATPFRRNANSLQGELAACQRYYWRNTGGGFYSSNGNGNAFSTTQAQIIVNPPVTLRAFPTSVEFGNVGLGDGTNAPIAITSIVSNQAGLNAVQLTVGVASGLTSFRPYAILNNNNNTGFLALSAEL